MGRKATYQEVRDRIKAHGLILISTEYKDQHTKIDVKCSCGKIFQTTANSIFSGKCRSCGCYCKQRIIETSRVDRTGEVHGMLTVIEYSRTIGKVALWKCRCECGNEIEVRSHNLKSGNSTSCGCIQFKGCERINGWYIGTIKNRAKSKKIEYNLTPEYLWDLFKKQNGKCALSGVDINIERKYAKTQTASLDRIDSSKGYIKGNVQWVHKIVNNMKWMLSQSEFVGWCAMIYENQIIKE